MAVASPMAVNAPAHARPQVLRSAAASSRAALAGLILRDLAVMRKHLVEFVLRTLIQPFLLVFVFLFVFPKIGQSVGGGSGGSAAFATVLVPGVVGISIMFQGVQSVALTLATEFGFTREIEDRVQAPCPVWLVAVSKVLSGVVQGLIAAAIVFPIAAVVHARGVHPVFNIKWAIVLTLLPLTCIAFSSLGLLMGCVFEPRNIGLMFGFIVLPITFLGGTYYQWTRLRPVKIGGFHWLQTVVLVNPLIYVTEGMRAAFTDISHMHLYVVYPVLTGFCALFMYLGIRKFRKRVLS
ncbi:MAG TPA: ABC transporter permease [Acidimicrobiales bacterium]|nr:ABC transporter permease [Acidimicrobiales bacterium]